MVGEILGVELDHVALNQHEQIGKAEQHGASAFSVEKDDPQPQVGWHWILNGEAAPVCVSMKSTSVLQILDADRINEQLPPLDSRRSTAPCGTIIMPYGIPSSRRLHEHPKPPRPFLDQSSLIFAAAVSDTLIMNAVYLFVGPTVVARHCQALRLGEERICLLKLLRSRGARPPAQPQAWQLVPFLFAIPSSVDFGRVQTCTHDLPPTILEPQTAQSRCAIGDSVVRQRSGIVHMDRF
jgi:hypothetical protein